MMVAMPIIEERETNPQSPALWWLVLLLVAVIVAALFMIHPWTQSSRYNSTTTNQSTNQSTQNNPAPPATQNPAPQPT